MSDFLQFPDDAVAVVTGGASGIGRAVVESLAGVGVRVAAWDIDEARLNDVADGLRDAPGQMSPVRVDVTSSSSVSEGLRITEATLGPSNFLVNNAGPSSFTPIGSFDEGVAASLGSMQLVTTTWLRGQGAAHGNVVNVSSVAGAITGAGVVDWYAAAKSGIAGYTRFLALSRPKEMRCNAVAPGIIATPRTQDLRGSEAGSEIEGRNPMNRYGQPDEVASAITYLLSPAASYVNGVLLPVDGGSVIVL